MLLGPSSNGVLLPHPQARQQVEVGQAEDGISHELVHRPFSVIVVIVIHQDPILHDAQAHLDQQPQ